MAGRLESSLHNEFVLRPAKGEKGAKKAVGVIKLKSRRSPLIGARHMPNATGTALVAQARRERGGAASGDAEDRWRTDRNES
jgi:hypothetical protein